MMRLTAAERRRLQTQLHATHDARVYRRTLAVLQVTEGRSAEEVASLLQVAPRTVWRWLQSYTAQRDPAALLDRPGRGRPGLWNAEHWAVLEEVIGDRPQDWGYAASQWTVPLLRRHLAHGGLQVGSEATLRRRLHELGMVWKRPRYVLEPDPEAEKKTPDSKQAHASAASQRSTIRG